MLNDINDTICAVSTPMSEAGIGIVRISGADAVKIADKIFRSKSGRAVTEYKTFTMHYGFILNESGDKNTSDILDEVLLSVMKKPNTYTKEDVVEINCHSGIAVLRGIMELVIKNGARMAEPGEFTKRAFLNGRIDLAQAEAVLNIIKSKTDKSLDIALKQLRGGLSQRISGIKESLIEVLAHIEAAIDFPDEDIQTQNIDELLKRLTALESDISALVDSSEKGRIYKEGVSGVIAGRPNVGKSSLMNALLKKDRVIVTPIEGTTRDVVEDLISIQGIAVRLYDTAGIAKAWDTITKEAVKRAKDLIEEADLILFVLDGSQEISDEDREFYNLLKGKKVIVVINKTDLIQVLDISEIKSKFKTEFVTQISALKTDNLESLENAIAKAILTERKDTEHGQAIITELRHKTHLEDALRNLKNAVTSTQAGRTEELIAFELKTAIAHLDSITGAVMDTEVLDRIFSNFCIGK